MIQAPWRTDVTISREEDRHTDQDNSVDCGVGEERCACRAGNPYLHSERTAEAPEEAASEGGLEGDICLHGAEDGGRGGEQSRAETLSRNTEFMGELQEWLEGQGAQWRPHGGFQACGTVRRLQ